MRRAAVPKIGKDDFVKPIARTPFGLIPEAAADDKVKNIVEEEEEQKDASPGSVGLKRKLSFDEV